jgi:3-phosphoshikimate 1-carboxyvinyltransferase
VPRTIAIEPTGPLHATVRPPGSKSITNRALVCAALARGRSTLDGALDSDDTRVMIEALRRLDVPVQCDFPVPRIEVHGSGGVLRGSSDPAAPLALDLAGSGTSIRFLTAAVAAGQGYFRLDGNARMRQRPIADLLHALAQLGANVRTELPTGCPPVLVHARGLAGGVARVRGEISSQFLSALLLAAPAAQGPVELHIDGALVSQPYVDMTLAVMEAFGAVVQRDAYRQFRIQPQAYRACRYAIEPDASAASYFFAAAAITGGEVAVEGLSRRSLQGDVAFVDVLAQMGCEVRYLDDRIVVARRRPLHGVDVDMNAISDTVQTLAAVALFAQGPTTIRGVAHIRHKETDRIAALATELRKLGAEVQERDDGLRIEPRPLRPAVIDTYDDHRMAMSLALVGLAHAGVVIHDPDCTAKTYPRFFDDLAALRSR